MTESITQILYPIVEWCHALVGNWWVAILLFTVITKVLLMPLALWSHRNSITMVELMPDLFHIKTRFFGDRETIEEKQNELYKRRHYHVLLSLVPLIAQIVILFGLSGVIRTIAQSGDAEVVLLGTVPSEAGFPLLAVVPLLAALSSLVQGLAANRINPLQREQSRAEKATTNGISIALSLFLAAFVVCGMAFYWICSNLLAIAVQLACNGIIRPANYIDYEELAAARKEYEALEASTASRRAWYERDPYVRKERADYQRFFSIEGKHLVFYSEGSGFYKYFKGAIEWLLLHSDIQIYYVTSDPEDQVFAIAEQEPRLLPYYVGQRRLITLMMKMDADVVAMSIPALDNYYLKRSYVRDDITYVYIPHHTTSYHLTSLKHDYDHFDEVFCVGPHQVVELRRLEEMNGAPAKELPLIGYDLIDEEIRAYESVAHEDAHTPPVVLVAPSWNQDNILDSCIDEMLDVLLARGYRVIVRPHPEYTKRYRSKWEALIGRYAHIPEERLFFERDFSSNESILDADTIITDWSTINLEFSFTTLKPSIFIDTTMKVNNPDWEKLGIVPTDISIRNEIGRSLAPEALSELPDLIDDLLAHASQWKDDISSVRSRMISNLGHGGERAGERLLELVLEHQGGDGQGHALEEQPAEGTSGPEAKHFGGKRISSVDVACALLGVAAGLALVPRPALAYVDPSVMTYTIQALAAVAVALSAVIGVAFRKTRSVIFKLFHVDEKMRLLIEPPVHRISPEQKAETDEAVQREREASAAAYRKRQVSISWPARLALSLLAVGLPIFTVFVVAPIELVANNASSLVFGVDMIGAPIVRVGVIAIAVGAFVLSLVRGKPFHILLAAITALGLAAYLESLFFGHYLPLADGAPVNWDNYTRITVLSLALWIAALVGMVGLAAKKPQLSRSIGAALALVLIIIQLVGVASLSTVSGAGTDVLRGDDGNAISPENYVNATTELGLFDVSEQDNVVIFVLDMTDSSYIRELLDGYYPEILDGLEGFTFYENSGGGMIPTGYGVPLLLTGSTPQPGQMMFDYIDSRYPDSRFLPDIAELGYSIGIYSDSIAMSDAEAYLPASYTINNRDERDVVEVITASFDEQGARDILYRCALYRHVPWLFKPPFRYYTDDINQGCVNARSERANGDERIYQTDDVRYYQQLMDQGLAFNSEEKSFRFVHLNGTHWPYMMTRDIERQESSTLEQCIGAFNIVKAYLDELRRLGVYDQTTVIITADHGVWYPIDSTEVEPIDRATSPIIFVKPAQTAEEASQPCQISQAPVTIIDLMPTILEAMGADEETIALYEGRPIDEIGEDEERLRYFYMPDRDILEDGSIGDYMGLWEYIIDGDVSDFDNWEFTGNVNPRNDTYYVEHPY